MLRIEVWTAMTLLGVALAGCGGAGAAGEGGSASYEGAIASNDVAGGEQVFNEACGGCHGGGPSLQDLAWDPARMRRQIREGSGGMPALSLDDVSDDDVEAVLAFLVTIGAVASDEAAGAGPTTGGEAEPEGAGDPEPSEDAEGGAEEGLEEAADEGGEEDV